MDKVENTLVDLMGCLARCEGIDPDSQQDILILMARMGDADAAEYCSRPMNHEHQDHKEGEGVEWDGDMPPVGVWVDLVNEDDHVEVMCHGKGTKFCGRDKDGYIGIFDAEFAEPVQSHRDKCIEAADRVWQHSSTNCTHESFFKLAVDLYDRGMLKLPGEEQ